MNSEILTKLTALKNHKLNKMRRYEAELLKLNREISEINSQICSLDGHSFTSWNLKQNSNLDKNCYLERTCEVCGRVERKFDTESLNNHLVHKHSTK